MTLDEIIQTEPRITVILRKLKRSDNLYCQLKQYSAAKHKIADLVGWSAERQELRTEDAWHITIDAVLAKVGLL